MKNILCATALMLGTFTGAASAASLEESGWNIPSPSIIYLGEPDPCDNGACDEELAATEKEDRRDNNAALIDAYGMPTSMPVIMRPSVDTPPQDTASAATAPAAPAGTEQPKPQEVTPQAETPAPTPVAQEQSAPVEQSIPQPDGQQNPDPKIQ